MAMGEGIDITYDIVDTNETTLALTGNGGTLVRYYSHAYCYMVAYSHDPIDESLYIIRNGSNTIYGNEGTFENVESATFTFSAENAAGVAESKTVKMPMVDYVKLTCNIANDKPDTDGSMYLECSGNYFGGSFGAVNNTLTVECRYNRAGSYSEWIPMTIYSNGNYYAATASFDIANFDYTATYEFECRATDKLATVYSYPVLAKSLPVFHWGEDDFQFEVPVTVNGDADITGDLRLSGNGVYGSTLRFGDGDRCYLAEKVDDKLTIHASEIYLDSSYVFVNGKKLDSLDSGTWTPTLNESDAVLYYTTRYGWYSKVGDTVTVGFYIKAYCDAGYEGATIAISGLPYTPAFSAAGGGMCSGAYVSGGHTFQCFVAESDGEITTRVQACDNTYDENLSTSASGCNYRCDGGELTLSGTITYMV